MDARAIDRATYVHYCIGGPEDGRAHPSDHCYDTFRCGDGPIYHRVSEPERMEEGPPGLQVLNCTDDYFEPVFYRVTMRLKGTDNG